MPTAAMPPVRVASVLRVTRPILCEIDVRVLYSCVPVFVCAIDISGLSEPLSLEEFAANTTSLETLDDDL